MSETDYPKGFISPGAAAMALLLSAAPAGAVVVHGVELTRPTSYVGRWAGSSAVAIGERYAITAAHIGGSLSSRFVLSGEAFAPVAIHLHPVRDLAILEFGERLPGWHELAGGIGAGDGVLIGGFGVTAGAGSEAGYVWSDARREAWGANVVASVTSERIAISFDRGSASVPGEAVFARNDSGGGLFVESADGSLALAGIAVAIDHPYGFSPFGGGAFALNLTSADPFLARFVPGPGPLALAVCVGCTVLRRRGRHEPRRFPENRAVASRIIW